MYRIIGADGKEYGPISAATLCQWIEEGRASGESRVLMEGTADWKALGSFPEFSSALAAANFRRLETVPVRILPARKTNGFAMASLILGIISLCCFCCCYGFPFNIIGLIFGLIGLAQIGNNPQLYQGKGIAVAGLVLCILSLLCCLGLLSISGMSGRSHKSPRHTYRL